MCIYFVSRCSFVCFRADEPFLFVFSMQADIIFEVLKAYLKRAPSLKGAALVKLSQLKIQVNPWHVLTNLTRIASMLDGVSCLLNFKLKFVINHTNCLLLIGTRLGGSEL